MTVRRYLFRFARVLDTGKGETEREIPLLRYLRCHRARPALLRPDGRSPAKTFVGTFTPTTPSLSCHPSSGKRGVPRLNLGEGRNISPLLSKEGCRQSRRGGFIKESGNTQ